MGTGTFFSKVASYDPLAQALHLPGAGKYDQQQTRDSINEQSANASLPYAGQTPTLAGANAGYLAAAKAQLPQQAPAGGAQRQTGYGQISPYQAT